MKFIEMQYAWTEQQKKDLESEGWRVVPQACMYGRNPVYIATREAES
jgi:hypothetical protein